jgi:molybdate transport system substrate-binding protein
MIILSIIFIPNNIYTEKKIINQSNEIIIFAAASTAIALKEIAKHLSGNFNILFNFASSSILARQVINGAKCDLVLLSDVKWMNFLCKSSKIINNSRIDLLSNRLVLVSSKYQKFFLKNLLYKVEKSFFNKFVIADPNVVPLGGYTKEVLHICRWNILLTRLLKACNIRSTLLYIENAEATSGIVYYTDAKASNYIRIIANIPTSMHQFIYYPFARCGNLISLLKINYIEKFLIAFYEVSCDVFSQYGFIYLNKNL